jgi:hypothetical protein
LIAQIPEHLKNPANYLKMQAAILETLATTHSHGEVVDWAKCVACQKRFREHGEFIKKLGFRTPRHYFAWKKIMETIYFNRRTKLR